MRASLIGILGLLVACGDDGSAPAIPDAPPPPVDALVLPSTCDFVDQDCPGGYKCTFIVAGILRPGCRPVTGQVGEDEACTGIDGDDDCAAGLLCVHGRCKRFCETGDDCATTQACAFYRTGDGVCEEPCTLFEDSSCPSGYTCDLGLIRGTSSMLTRCRLIGTGTEDKCYPSTLPRWECDANEYCNGDTCKPLCDDTHPCATGSCTLAPGLDPNPANAGACLD